MARSSAADRAAQRALTEELERLAEGRIVEDHLVTDLTGEAGAALARVANRLRDSGEQLSRLADGISEMPAKVSAAMHEVEVSAEEQEGAVEETASLLANINKEMRDIAAEVENLALGHPARVDCAAIAVPDDIMGEKVCLCVVARDPAHPPTLTEVTDWMREQGFGSYKLPESLRVVEAIPRNPVGKILKRELREATTPAN